MNIDRDTIFCYVSCLFIVGYLICIVGNFQTLSFIMTFVLLLFIVEILFKLDSIIKQIFRRAIRFWRTISPQNTSCDSPRTEIFSHTIAFFESSTNLITIVGAIVTIISLSPLFLTLVLGDDWFHILLTTQFGIQALIAVVAATFFAAFFIYCILALILIRWIIQIFLNNEVRGGEKLFSFVILLSGIIATFCLVWFLLSVWFSRSNIPILLIGLIAIIFISALALTMMISGLIDITGSIPSVPITTIVYVVIIGLFGAVVVTIVIPAITINNSIYQTASNYTDPQNYSFSLQPSVLSDNKTVLIQPDYSNYPNSSINVEYMDCHWSTNYGYFMTITNGTVFVQKRSNDFVIQKCIQKFTERREEKVYWTYDISDYSKIKPPVIISLQVENSNKRSLNEKLGESKDYVVGGNFSNFTWVDTDNITESKAAFF